MKKFTLLLLTFLWIGCRGEEAQFSHQHFDAEERTAEFVSSYRAAADDKVLQAFYEYAEGKLKDCIVELIDADGNAQTLPWCVDTQVVTDFCAIQATNSTSVFRSGIDDFNRNEFGEYYSDVDLNDVPIAEIAQALRVGLSFALEREGIYITEVRDE